VAFNSSSLPPAPIFAGSKISHVGYENEKFYQSSKFVGVAFRKV